MGLEVDLGTEVVGKGGSVQGGKWITLTRTYIKIYTCVHNIKGGGLEVEGGMQWTEAQLLGTIHYRFVLFWGNILLGLNSSSSSPVVPAIICPGCVRPACLHIQGRNSESTLRPKLV